MSTRESRIDRLSPPLTAGSITLFGLVVTTIFFFYGARSLFVPDLVSLQIYGQILWALKLAMVFLVICSAMNVSAGYAIHAQSKLVLFGVGLGFGSLSLGILTFIVAFVIV
jgi:hypothetical protein